MGIRSVEVESVWDYPRPPAVTPCSRRVRIEHDGVLIADSTLALRVLETSHPPGIYVPATDVHMDHLVPVPGRSTYCEWKGHATYFDVGSAAAAAWGYPDPVAAYAALRGFVSFYPGRVDACYLDDERVRAQEGTFYGGWVTDEIQGPFKGGAGTLGW